MTVERAAALTSSDRVLLLRLARDAIAAALSGAPLPVLEAPQGGLAANSGVFVSVYVVGELRGCIGTLESDEPFWSTVLRMAVSAASQDARFTPLRRDEIEAVEIEISRLTAPQPASAGEIEVGRHGVLLVHGECRAVFLPQVAPKYDWDVPTLLRELCIKATLEPEAWRETRAQIFVFEAERFSSGRR